MDNKTKKQILQSYGITLRRIERLEEEAELWRARAEKCTVSFSAAPCGNGDDRIQSAIEKIAEIEEKILQNISDAAELRSRIEKAISDVEDKRLALLLEYKYIDGLPFERVAEKMNYTARHIFGLHGVALSMLDGEKLIKKENTAEV